MTKPILTSALALAMAAGVAAPAHAADSSATDSQSYSNSFTCIPLYLIYLLLPAVQYSR